MNILTTRTTWKKALVALLSLMSICKLNAYSNGAGQCLVGQPAVAGTHLRQTSTNTGTLADGGFAIKVLDKVEVPHEGLLTVGNAVGFIIQLTVQATGTRAIKGVSIVVSGSTDAVEVDGAHDLQLNPVCPNQAAITHKDASEKSFANTTIVVDEEATLHVDITVVAQNSNGISEFYYSRFQMEVLQQTLEELFDDCLAAMVEADGDKNGVLNADEYYTFVGFMGERRCYSQPAELTALQVNTYKSLACTSCVSIGGEPRVCCIDPDALDISNALRPIENMDPVKKGLLRNICQSTNARIPPGCNSSTKADAAMPEPTPAPTQAAPVQTQLDVDACFDALSTADQDNNLALDEDEYFEFLVTIGKDRCQDSKTIDGTLDELQRRVFVALACSSCSHRGLPTTCCDVNEKSIAVDGAEDPKNSTLDGLSWLASVCLTSDAILFDRCGDHGRRDLSLRGSV